MADITEILWHGRGGQGAKTAATLSAEVACSEGKYSQGFPEYGPERMGAPIKGYTRISNGVIRLHCSISEPDIIVVLDETLFNSVNILEGASDDTKLLVNTPCSPAELRQKYNIDKLEIYAVEATLISIEEMKRDMPNTPMLGGLAKIAGPFKLETLIADLTEQFSHKFTDQVVKANVRAIKRAYKEVKSE